MDRNNVDRRQDRNSYDMRLLTKAVTEIKDVSLLTGPQKSSSNHLAPRRTFKQKLFRFRGLHRGRATAASVKTGQGHECYPLDRMEHGLGTRGPTRPVEAAAMNFGGLVLFYLQYTSAHGLPRAARSSSVVRRVLWAGTFAFFVAYFMYQFVALLTMFYNFPVGVKIVIEQKRVIEFPAVTVCNLNIMKVSRLAEDPKYKILGGIDSRIQKQVDHLLGALHLEETQGDQILLKLVASTSGDSWDDDEHEDDESTAADQRFLRHRRKILNRGSADIQNRSSTKDTSSNNTGGTPAVGQGKPIRIRPSPSNESVVVPPLEFLHLPRNRKYADFNYLDNGLSRELKDFKFHENNFGNISNDYEFDQLIAHSLTSDYSDILDLLKPTSEDLERFGHQAKDFIIQCSMDSISCSYRDFQRRESPFYGNCYTFNHGSGDSPVILTSKYGSRYGLRLTLNIEHDEYLGLFSQKAGVRVAIHPFNFPPFPEDFGLNASPGSETEIGVTMEYVQRIPKPYPSNCTDRKMYHSSLHWEGEGLYTVMSCIKTCLQRKMERYCGCVDSEVTSAGSMVVRCLSTNSSQEICRQTVRYLYETNHQGCDCPPPCQEVLYKTTISSAIWPSQPYASLLASALMEEKSFFRKSDIFKSIKLNLASIHIYLADMNVKHIDEYPSYPWDRLLADIGGMLGLFVGISACTVMELFEFLFDALLLAFRKCRT